jgi:DNA helicase-2/ATP-dependent DNA helicase PcrA
MTELNSEQEDAVNTLEGSLLVIAGAGSGKTRVVTFRIANLLKHGVLPSQILGLTFTNKAAREMQERVMHLTERNVLICTFHSLGARILRESIDRLGYRRDFTIYDEEDINRVLKLCVDNPTSMDKAGYKELRSMISHSKNNLLFDKTEGDENEPHYAKLANYQLFPQIYAKYREKLREYNALDFDDLLYLTVRLFREHPDILEHYQMRWPFLLIDEYQDTNAVQYYLVRALVKKSGNICVVGDPDQSIYSWRGANVGNILNFGNDYPGTKVVNLNRNYRSRSNILNAANAVIRNNSERYEKKLWSDLGPGEKIKRYSGDHERAEAAFIADKILTHRQNNTSMNEMVIFYRTNAQSRPFEDAFIQKRIPYVIVGGISFYQRREIKDILAFLRMVHSNADFVSFERTINLPKRGIGPTTIEKIQLGATQENCSILSYCEQIVTGHLSQAAFKLSKKQRDGLQEYVSIINRLKEYAKHDGIGELVKAAIVLSQYEEYLREDKETFSDRMENLNALIAKAIEWELSTAEPTLSLFLEELSLKSSLDEAEGVEERVSLMTVHNGKGLEFTVTFLAGMEEGLFPHINSKDDDNAVEEERRLCYVGMTRAKEYLYLTDCRMRFMWGITRTQHPSRFIREIPGEYIEKIGHSFASQGKSSLGWSSKSTPKPIVKEDSDFIDDMDQTASDEQAFVQGETIFHKQFGVGCIRSVYQSSSGMTYKIYFSKDESERSIVAKYAHLTRL